MRIMDAPWRAVECRNSELQRTIAGALFASVTLLLALGVFLLIRRASGAFTAPLPPLLLLATALALLTCVWGIRVSWLRFVAPNAIFSPKLDHWLFVWLPSTVIVLFAVACSYPGNRIVDWLTWVPAIATVSVPWKTHPSTKRRSTVIRLESKPETLLQQLTRSRTVDGIETIQGKLLAEFVSGQRSVDLFVGFCPPFEHLPNVEAEPEGATDAAVKLVQVLHNGAHLEVRLAQTATIPISVSIQLFAAEPIQNGLSGC